MRPKSIPVHGSGSVPVLDFAYAMTAGLLNNKFMFGVGYDLGAVEDGRGRFFVLVSAGVAFGVN